jgi:hypothetical protein
MWLLLAADGRGRGVDSVYAKGARSLRIVGDWFQSLRVDQIYKGPEGNLKWV